VETTKQLPNCRITQQCLKGIFDTVQAILLQTHEAFAESSGIPKDQPIDATTADKSQWLAPLVCGDTPLPDATDFDRWVEQQARDSIRTGVDAVKEDNDAKVIGTNVERFYEKLTENALNEPDAMKKTIAHLRKQVTGVVDAAASCNMSIDEFLSGDEAVNRIARAAYSPEQLKNVVAATFEVLSNPDQLKQIYAPLAQQSFGSTDVDQAELDKALTEIVSDVSVAMKQAIDEATINTIDPIFAH